MYEARSEAVGRVNGVYWPHAYSLPSTPSPPPVEKGRHSLHYLCHTANATTIVC